MWWLGKGKKQGYEPVGTWPRAVVYEPSIAGVSIIAICRALAKDVGIKGVSTITPISKNQGFSLWSLLT